MRIPEMLVKSIVVVAHPDDEVLWFSSILTKVNEVVICFLEHKSKPQWGIGRKKSLSEYPIKNISCLNLVVAEVFGGADWNNPVITKFGIEISNKVIPEKKYKKNYYKLKKELSDKLIGYRNIFTHNPWGEYGHEEHIQIYRVVKELQKEMGFNLWFSNYCSNISFNLLSKSISGSDWEYVTSKTNNIILNNIKDLYKKNECWTWYDDWESLNEESFIKDNTFQVKREKFCRIFPMNMIKVETTIKTKKRPDTFKHKIYRILKKLV